jgi:hypothetical protein
VVELEAIAASTVKVYHAAVVGGRWSALFFLMLKIIVVGGKVETMKTLSVEWSKDGLGINAPVETFCEVMLQQIYT